MPVFALGASLLFPPVHLAESDGLIAVGGDLSIQRLLTAYRNGIFPWYDGKPILWWCPNPRFVLFPGQLKVSKSMHKLVQRDAFTFTVNNAFTEVIAGCKNTSRNGQHGTWITDDVQAAYTTLHHAGYAHSAEAWTGGRLVGGLYGIRLGNVFFGESMFSHESNASKYAFIRYVYQLQQEGVALIDCQMHTNHLESLGATMISRNEFIALLKELL